MNKLSNFHDATLVSVNFDLTSEKLLCEIIHVSNDRHIENLVFDAVKDVCIPHRMPWGRSNSVNSISRKEVADGIEFSIEMQSGDVIRVIADRLIQ